MSITNSSLLPPDQWLAPHSSHMRDRAANKVIVGKLTPTEDHARILVARIADGESRPAGTVERRVSSWVVDDLAEMHAEVRAGVHSVTTYLPQLCAPLCSDFKTACCVR